MSVHDTILNRHSVRKFSDKTIEKEKLDRVLNAARLAPSWRNQQCWHFIVVDDHITRNEIIKSTHVFNQTWLGVTQNPVLSVLLMMALAVCLSLCAEADAFVARSFVVHFPMGSIISFMVFGQMFDLKNLALLLKNFQPKER